MKLWRWFVGQVARLRRSVVGDVASGSQAPHADDRPTFADEAAPGPPAHWVERVRRGAPGLLEPSLRRRGGPVEPPPAERIALSQTKLDPEPESLEEPERGYARTEPTVAPRRPAAPVRAPLLRKVFRRTRSHSAPPVTPATAPDHVSHELDTATRRVSNPGHSPASEPERVPSELEAATSHVSKRADSPAAETHRGPLSGETTRTAAPSPPVTDGREHSQGPPVPDKPERSPGRSEVVAFEAPVQGRTSRLERPASPPPPREAEVARPSSKNIFHAALAFAETGNARLSEPSGPSPAPRRAAVRRLEPALTRPRPTQESSVEPGPPHRRRAERLSEAGAHPWPELPPPLDQPDSDVEAALRAWEHQRRLDLEQTRL